MSDASRPRLRFLALGLCLAGIAGCSGTTLSGDVTLNGQPVDGGTITLLAPGGGKQRNVAGDINGGRYTLTAAAGLAPGTYKVEIFWHQKTGRKLPNPNDIGTFVEEAKQVVPTQYNVATTLTAEVKSGSNTLNFDLKGPPPKVEKKAPSVRD